MRKFTSLKLLALLLVTTNAGAQAGNPDASADTPARPPATATTPDPIKSGLTVTGVKPTPEPPLPKIPPDQFSTCSGTSVGAVGGWDINYSTMCQIQLAMEERVVIDKCTNRDGKADAAVALQACNELLDRDMLHGHDRAYLYVNRARAYWAGGDKAHALEDYNRAVELAPRSGQPYYYRGVFHATQAEWGAALHDLDTALNLDPRLVAALLERAKIHEAQKEFGPALADFSAAIELKPAMADAWSGRGYLYLLQQDFDAAIRDEARAIELDRKLALAWYLRAAAYGNLGDAGHAVDDVKMAVDLDPSLARYILTKGKTATLTLPPL